MVDIHSHILHEVDDGSTSLAESLEMVEVAIAAGTTDIVATPHASIEYKFDPEVIAGRLAELREAVGDRLRIHAGCDFHLSYDNIQDAFRRPARYTINGLNYLLVEFSDLAIFKGTEETFLGLMRAGMRPIITHPERNQLLQQRLEQMRGWVDMGCMIQVTSQSLTGLFGSTARRFSETLLNENLVHFLASDAHDPVNRSPRLDEARKIVEEGWSRELAEALTVHNPKAVLEGKDLPALPKAPERRRRKWYQVWS
jgi:protein-tyrosine phosphatase